MQRIARWLNRFRPASFMPSLADDGDPPPIDGISYSQPPIVPWHVDRSDGAAVRQYLEHNSASGVDSQRSTYRFQFDGNRTPTYDGQVIMPVDDPLCEWDNVTRLAVLTDCHAAYQRNPLAKQAVDLTRRFVVGKGHTVTAANEQVNEVIEEFRANEENYIYGYDRTFIQDLQVDGELFVRFASEDGQTVMAQNPPWWIKSINTAAGFRRRIDSYALEYMQGGEQKREKVPAEQVLFVTINNAGYELRGRPDLFTILPWLRAYNEWLVDRARQNKWRGALLWVVKVASRIPGDVAAVRSVFRRPPTPGSTAVVPDNVEIEALTNRAGANDAAEDGRQIKLQAAVGVGMPEYMLSDGENANLASATAQQLPALWKFTDYQELMKEQVWTPIYKRVIQAAVDAGKIKEVVEAQDSQGDPVLLPDGSTKMVDAVDAFEVGYHELQSDDPKSLAEAVALLTATEIISTQTAREKIGEDHATEESRLEQEQGKRDERAAKMGEPNFSDENEDEPETEESDDDNE